MQRKTILFFIVFNLLFLSKYSFAEKIWPKEPLRGINTVSVANERGNTQNPGGYLSEETFKKFSEWNINLIRFPLRVDRYSIWDVKKGDVPPVPKHNPLLPYRKHMEGLRVALKLAEKYHIYVIPTASNVVGRIKGILYNVNNGSGSQNTLIELWKHVAKEFGTNQWLLAYDLLNEPHSKNEIKYWQEVTLPTIIKEIRTIDKDTYLIVEPAPWGNPGGLKKLTPVTDPKVVYSFHFYAPHTYTHQGVKKNKPTKGKLVYPGRLKMHFRSSEIYWDRNQMVHYVDVARKFQKRHNVRILIGEFSAIRWAPGAAQWISDAISVFEEYEWDWCYHSYGGWNGWNPTFSADAPTNNNPDGGNLTERLQVLLKAWEINRKY